MKRIVAIDTFTGRVVASYKSIADCSRATGIGETTLGAQCRHRRYPRAGRIAYRYADDAGLSEARRKTPSPVFAVARDGTVLGIWQNARAAAHGLSYSESYTHRCLRERKAVRCNGVPCMLVRPNRPGGLAVAS